MVFLDKEHAAGMLNTEHYTVKLVIHIIFFISPRRFFKNHFDVKNKKNLKVKKIKFNMYTLFRLMRKILIP